MRFLKRRFKRVFTLLVMIKKNKTQGSLIFIHLNLIILVRKGTLFSELNPLTNILVAKQSAFASYFSIIFFTSCELCVYIKNRCILFFKSTICNT